jgi:hypothetical protein
MAAGKVSSICRIAAEAATCDADVCVWLFTLLILQGQDGEVRWVMYQLGYIFTGLFGLLGLCVSGCWLAHIIVYMLPPIPIHPLLNEVFIKLDGVFPLFGVAAFAAFCGYLLGE